MDSGKHDMEKESPLAFWVRIWRHRPLGCLTITGFWAVVVVLTLDVMAKGHVTPQLGFLLLILDAALWVISIMIRSYQYESWMTDKMVFGGITPVWEALMNDKGAAKDTLDKVLSRRIRKEVQKMEDAKHRTLARHRGKDFDKEGDKKPTEKPQAEWKL